MCNYLKYLSNFGFSNQTAVILREFLYYSFIQ